MKNGMTRIAMLERLAVTAQEKAQGAQVAFKSALDVSDQLQKTAEREVQNAKECMEKLHAGQTTPEAVEAANNCAQTAIAAYSAHNGVLGTLTANIKQASEEAGKSIGEFGAAVRAFSNRAHNRS